MPATVQPNPDALHSPARARSPLEVDLDQREHTEKIPPPDADAFDRAQRRDRGEHAPEPEGGDAPPPPAREPRKGEARSPLEVDSATQKTARPARTAATESESDTGDKLGGETGEGGEGEPKPKIGMRNIGPREIRRAEDWKLLKAERDKWRKEAEELRAGRTGTSTATPGADTDDLKALRAERDQYRDIVRQAAIERDPQFNAEFETRRRVAVDQAKLAAGDKADTLGKLLAIPPSPWRDQQIDTLLTDMPASTQRRLNAALGILDQIEIERQGRIEQARASWDQRQTDLLNQQHQQMAQHQQKLMGTFERVLQQHQRPGDEGIYFYQAKEGDEAHNNAIAQSVQIARDMLSGKLDEEDMVRASLIVGASDRLFKQMEAQEQTIAELRSTIKRLRGVDPDSGGRTELSESGRPQKVPLYGEAGDRDYFDANYEAAQRADRKGRWD